MRSILLALLVALGVSGAASAQNLRCIAREAVGEDRLSVVLEVDPLGSILTAEANLALTPKDKLGPFLLVWYAFPKVRDPQLGPAGGAVVTVFVNLQPPPRSRTADIVVAAAGRQVRRPWQMYARQMAELTKETEALVGTVPLPEAGAALAQAQQEATPVEVSAVTGDGQVLGQGAFVLPAREAVQAAADRAHAATLMLANAPKANCKLAEE